MSDVENIITWKLFQPSYPFVNDRWPTQWSGAFVGNSRTTTLTDCTLAPFGDSGRLFKMLNAGLPGATLQSICNYLVSSNLLTRIAQISAPSAPLFVLANPFVNDGIWSIQTPVSVISGLLEWFINGCLSNGGKVLVCADYMVGPGAQSQSNGFNNPLIWSYADLIRPGGSVYESFLPIHQGSVAFCDPLGFAASNWSTPSSYLQDDIHPTPETINSNVLPAIESAINTGLTPE